MTLIDSLLRRDKPPVLLDIRSSPSLIVTTASIATFTDVFLYAVIVPVMPFSLSTRVGVAEKDVQYWISISLAVYGVALLTSSPVWGYLADRIRNRKIPMLVGLIFLTGSTILLCLATTIGMLLAGRILQGISGALTWTVGLALVVDTVENEQLGTAMGWIGMGTSLGVLLAPLLGGVVYGRGGYYPVFAMCFGVLAVDIFLRLFLIEVKEAKQWRQKEEDLAAQLEGDSSVVTGPHPPASVENDTVQPAVENNTSDLEKNHVQQIKATTATNQPESKTSGIAHTLGPLLGLLRNPRLLAALWGTLMQAIIQTSFDSTLALFVKSTFHWDAIGAGLAFLPIVVPCFLSPLIGAANDKYGPKWLATSGFLIATPFLVCLRFVAEDTIGHKVMMCGLLVGVGLAIALVFGPLMAEITWAAAGDDGKDMSEVPYAQAYGLYNMSFSGGCILGPIIGGLVRDSAGWPTVCWVLGLLAAVSAIPPLIWTGGPLPNFLKRRKQTA